MYASATSSVICENESAILMASGASSYSWNSVSAAGSTIAVSPTITTVYILKGKDNNSCDDYDTLTVFVNALPLVSATATPTTICAGESVMLAAGGAVSFSWTTLSVFTETLTVTPAFTTTYVVTGEDINKCKNVSSVNVEVSECTGLPASVKVNPLVNIYPNPNDGRFTISCERELELILVNQLGQTLRKLDLKAENHNSIQISDLPNGIYFLYGSVQYKFISMKISVAK